MKINRETQHQINQFAREQSEFYLNEAEMTYLEKLRRKAGTTRSKVTHKIARFKNTSDQSRAVQDDMVLYMNDYMNDLMANGMSEQAAFEKARTDLSFASQSEQSVDLHERFQQYYQNRDPADYEAVGLFYGGFLLLGVAAGGLIGFRSGGGLPAFLNAGWINTLIGVATGGLIGIALGQISNAAIALRKRR